MNYNKHGQQLTLTTICSACCRPESKPKRHDLCCQGFAILLTRKKKIHAEEKQLAKGHLEGEKKIKLIMEIP